jgi:hypothetical protein
MKKSLLSVCSICAMAAALGYSHAAQAQTVDYGALQSLFAEPVTTNATGTPQRASEVAANMTIITANITDHFTLALSGFNINSSVTQQNPYLGVERQALLMLTGKF